MVYPYHGLLKYIQVERLKGALAPGTVIAILYTITIYPFGDKSGFARQL
jgi:hypothetical protein